LSKIDRSALVNYSAQQMFDLVNDIESYPEFMDGCVAAKIIKNSEQEMEACLELKKSGFGSRFVTRNSLNPPIMITMNLIDGPFEYLRGTWTFTALNESACKVSFVLEFKFKNLLTALAGNKLFEAIASKQVDAICDRAKKIYS
jgi:ribosome-associated toxin RatA of RatAB toxin-antitoxin module